MTNPFLRGARLALLSGICLSAVPGAHGQTTAPARPWTVETSANMRYVIDADDPSEQALVQHFAASPVLPSPDGSKFAVLTRRGDIATDKNIYQLSIYDSDAVRKAVASGRSASPPLRTITRRSGSVWTAIAGVTWAADSRSLTFEGTLSEAGANAGVLGTYRLDPAANGEPELLCPCLGGTGNLGKMGYLLDERGGKALYVAELPVTRDDRNIAYPAEVVTPDVNSRMMGLRFSAAGSVGLFTYVGGVSRRVAGFPESAVGVWPNAGAIAPNGDAAIMATKVGEGGASGGNLWRVVRVDMVAGTATPLLDLRLTTGRPSIRWSPDGTRLLVLNAIAPRDGSNIASVLVLDPATGSAQTVAAIDADSGWATAARWAPDGRRIVIERRAGKPNPDDGEAPSGPASPVVYELAGGSWRRSSEAAPPAPSPRIIWGARRTPYSAEARKQSANPSWEPRPLPLPVIASNGLSITLDESPDRPQRVIAAVGRRSLNLLGPSEDLAGVQISHSRTVEWTTSDGRIHRGLLTVPIRASSTPPPLVIQLSEYMPNVFRPDGSVFSGFASQATAARGMAVLQMSFSDMAGALKDEIRLTREDVDAAIASLAAAGAIDPARVAMSGFSHTGMLVRAILVQPGRFPLSAGVTNDSFTGAFIEHAYSTGVADQAPLGNALVHGGDFWDHRERWLAEAPDLAANHATGALLDIYHDYSLYMVGQILGPFKLARRPVELLIVPEGAHQLQRPRQRYASLSANVDWLDFWLQGHEDPDPAKAEQYSRWRAMRQAWTLQKSWEAAGNPAGTRPSSDFIKQHTTE